MTRLFDYRKATQALNFFATAAGGKIEMIRALKLVFFADRYHLRKYGRPVINDTYFAMKLGPVPSGVKDIASKSSFVDETEAAYAERFLSTSEPNQVATIAPVDERTLSATDLEALEFAWGNFAYAWGNFAHRKWICEITHAYPEWARHEAELRSGMASRVEMDYRDFLEDPVASVDPCFALSAQERSDRVSALEETEAFASRWD
jgi:uncharacterized phage-associated protein